jgi:hypothetical protein
MVAIEHIFEDDENGLRSEVFKVDDGYRVRLLDTDAGAVVPYMKTWPATATGLANATAYAETLIEGPVTAE